MTNSPNLRFRGDASLSTWLARIAINEARRRQRQRGRTVHIDALDSASQTSDAQIHLVAITRDQDRERATARHQIRILLERAIDDLPKTFCKVFVLRDVVHRIKRITPPSWAAERISLAVVLRKHLFRQRAGSKGRKQYGKRRWRRGEEKQSRQQGEAD
jgi:hypothetical protein